MTASALPTLSRPPLPPTFAQTQPAPTLVYQGAEALVYRTHFLLTPSISPTAIDGSTSTAPSASAPSRPTTSRLPAALKHRPSKPYRHPLLDAKLTRHRILSEARALVRLRREGVRQVPAVYALDWEQGWMLCEWVEGCTVKDILRVALAKEDVLATVDSERGQREEENDDEEDGVKQDGEREGEDGREEEERQGGLFAERRDEEALFWLMESIGRVVGRVHEKGVVHGDLTTSNLMVRGHTIWSPSPELHAEHRDEEQQQEQPRQQQPQQQMHEGANPEHSSTRDGGVVLIDFGLASQAAQDEDRAVDLYVLERAFGSTHPRTEGLWQEVLRAYGESYKGAKVVVRRLEEVRMRGRKKIMIG